MQLELQQPITKLNQVLVSSPGVEPPAITLTDAERRAAKSTITNLRDRHASWTAATRHTEREGFRITVDGWQAINAWGGPRSEFVLAQCEENLITGTNDDLYWHSVQLVEGGPPIAVINDKKAKKDRRNKVGRSAKLMAALDFFAGRGSFEDMDADGVTSWIIDNGGVNGVVAKHKAALAGNENEEDEDGEGIDLAPFREALDANAYSLTSHPAINASQPMLSLHRRSGDNLLVLRLALCRCLVAGAQALPDLPLTQNAEPHLPMAAALALEQLMRPFLRLCPLVHPQAPPDRSAPSVNELGVVC